MSKTVEIWLTGIFISLFIRKRYSPLSLYLVQCVLKLVLSLERAASDVLDNPISVDENSSGDGRDAIFQRHRGSGVQQNRHVIFVGLHKSRNDLTRIINTNGEYNYPIGFGCFLIVCGLNKGKLPYAVPSRCGPEVYHYGLPEQG